jgi:hypothetical protein
MPICLRKNRRALARRFFAVPIVSVQVQPFYGLLARTDTPRKAQLPTTCFPFSEYLRSFSPCLPDLLYAGDPAPQGSVRKFFLHFLL